MEDEEKKAFFEKIRNIVREKRYYDSLQDVLYCDRFHCLPEKGRPYMNEIGGFLSEKEQDRLTGKEAEEIAGRLRGMAPSDFTDDYQRGLARYFLDAYDEATKLPIDLKVELDSFCVEAQFEWKKAFQKADFPMFFPYLQRQFELQGKVARAIDRSRPPFEVLLNRVDKGFSLARLDPLVERVKEGLLDILHETEKKPHPDDSFLNVDPPKNVKMELAKKAADFIQFDRKRGHFYEMLHPVCCCVGPSDSRPSSNYTSVWKGILTLMHESGHGIYNYSSNEKVIQYGLWGGIYGTGHESQSRFYENMIGKSRAFWQYFYPLVQEKIPQLRGVPLSSFYPALTAARPTAKRTDADELTYGLHVIIRYEMERDYFSGRLKIEDFRKEWNQKYKDYLGITFRNDREGILQDVHWASGCVGYFQSYLLGDICACQIRHKMLSDIPDMDEQISKGRMDSVNRWLYQKIHQYGQVYRVSEIMKKATGEDINEKYFLDYLREKYLAD